MIREANKDDIKILDEYVTNFVRDEAIMYEENNKSDLIISGYSERRLNDKDVIIFVDVEDDKIVGFINGSFMRGNSVKKTDEVKIDMLYVIEEYRNKGIGSKLIDAFVNSCKDRGVKYLRIDNFIANEGASRLYERLGFTPHILERRKKL